MLVVRESRPPLPFWASTRHGFGGAAVRLTGRVKRCGWIGQAYEKKRRPRPQASMRVECASTPHRPLPRQGTTVTISVASGRGTSKEGVASGEKDKSHAVAQHPIAPSLSLVTRPLSPSSSSSSRAKCSRGHTPGGRRPKHQRAPLTLGTVHSPQSAPQSHTTHLVSPPCLARPHCPPSHLSNARR